MRLTKRGKRVRAILILALFLGTYYLINHLWWTGDHYCWGSLLECEFPLP